MKKIFVCCFCIFFMMSCYEEYNDLGGIFTRVLMESEIVKITDSYIRIHSEVLGGHGLNITAVGHEWTYFSQHIDLSDSIYEEKEEGGISSSYKRSIYHELTIHYNQDTMILIKAFVEVDDTIRMIEGSRWINTAERFEMDQYMNQ